MKIIYFCLSTPLWIKVVAGCIVASALMYLAVWIEERDFLKKDRDNP